MSTMDKMDMIIMMDDMLDDICKENKINDWIEAIEDDNIVTTLHNRVIKAGIGIMWNDWFTEICQDI